VGGENVMNARCFMWTFTLPLVASPASTCYPASLIFTGARSHHLPGAWMTTR